MRVLLAEDDPAQRELLEELLSLQGYELITAGTPLEALARLGDRPDAILLDVVGMTSPELRGVLRRMPERPAIVMVSGDPRLEKVAEWLGADGYIHKPYEVDRLLEALVRALQIRAKRLRREPDSSLADALLHA